MDNKLKTILIGLIAIFGAGFLLIPGIFAQANDNLIVQFEKTPLFDEANFLPGESITRWVKVTNNSGETKRIATEAINVKDPNRLGDVLNLEIKEGTARLYNGPLSQFFNAGEVYLSDLGGGGNQTQYDFNVTFYSGANNAFQGKTLGFDILVGFQGEEGGLTPGGGGGGGGFLPPGLTIQDETIVEVKEASVKISWLTSYSSTSQIIYGKEGEAHTLDLTDNIGTPPKYGYAHTTPEYDTSPKVTFHSITIDGLTPSTKYYFRCVSHASLAISQEYSFTTLGAQEIERIGEEEEGGAGEVPVVEISLDELFGKGQEKGEPVYDPEGAPAGEEGLVEKPSLTEVAVEEGPIVNLAGLLAAIGKLPLNLKVILVIVFLILIALIILWLFKKKKRERMF